MQNINPLGRGETKSKGNKNNYKILKKKLALTEYSQMLFLSFMHVWAKMYFNLDLL